MRALRTAVEAAIEAEILRKRRRMESRINRMERRGSKSDKTLPPRSRATLRSFVALLVLAAVLLASASYFAIPSDWQPVHLDGDFSDWVDVPDSGGWQEIVTQLRHYYRFAAPTGGRIDANRMDAFRLWLDTDADARTGLLVDGIGADLRLVLQFWEGETRSATLCTWQDRAQSWEYTEFAGCGGIPAASRGGRVEFALMTWVLGDEPVWIAETLPVLGPRQTLRHGESVQPGDELGSLLWRDYVQADGTAGEWPWLLAGGHAETYTSNTTGVGRLRIGAVTARVSLWNTSLLLNISAGPLPIPFRPSAPPSGEESSPPPPAEDTRGPKPPAPDRRDRLVLFTASENATVRLWQGRVMGVSATNGSVYAAGPFDALEFQVTRSWIGIGLTLEPSEDPEDAPIMSEPQDSFFAPTHLPLFPEPIPLDIPGNIVYWFRNIADATETACTGANDRTALIVQGVGAMQTVTLTTGQNACWYATGTTGMTTAAGDWETLLDIQTTGDNGGTGNGWGVAAYRSSTTTGVNYPKIAYWDYTGLGWSVEYELTTAGGPVENVRVEWDPAMSFVHYIAVNAADVITIYRCSDIGVCASLGTATTSTNSAPERRWDIAIEQSSGDGLLFYDGASAVAGSDFCYRTFTTTLSGETCVNHSWVNTTNPAIAWLDLASNPGVNNIAVSAFDTTNDDTILWMWDGSAFLTGNDERACTLAGTLTDSLNAEVAYEDSADEFVAYCGDGASNMNECEWTSGAGWEYDTGGTNTCTAFDPNPSANNDVRTMSCDEKLASNTVLCGQNDDTSDIDVWRWAGVAGTGGVQNSAFEPSFGDIGTIRRDYDLAWDPENDDTGDGVVVHWDGSDTRCEFKGFDNDGAAGWSGTNTFDTCTGSSSWVLAESNPWTTDPTAAMVLRSNSAFDLLAHQWTGCYFAACMDNEQTLTADLSDENYFHFDFAWGMRPVEYDVRIEIWNLLTDTVASTVGSCLNVVTRGDDVQCLISGVASIAIGASQVVRVYIAHSSAAGSVLIDYDDADSTGDSRLTVPIPEAVLITALVVLPLLLVAAWVRRRKECSA